MEKLLDKMEQIKMWAHRPRNKKRIYAALVLIVVLWVIGRFVMVVVENHRFVFNPARAAADAGLVVDVMSAKVEKGALREPVTVKNNRAMVSGARAVILKPGQKIGDGVIVSVSRGIDLDTGMHTVRTRGVADGLNYAECEITGVFVPSYAVAGDRVYVVDGGHAAARRVTIGGNDADTTVVTTGLQDGDTIILSRVTPGVKVQIKK